MLSRRVRVVLKRISAARTHSILSAGLLFFLACVPLFAQGNLAIAQKVGEEALDLALAAAAESDERVVDESADLIFHLLVLLRSRKLTLASVVAALAARHAARS